MARQLRTFVVIAGMTAAMLFVVIGLSYGLQEYADGSMFSYAIAAQDAWTFHWHNISGRLFVFLVIDEPAEFYVALTHDARGGIVLYGLLFFGAQLVGLLATRVADRSPGRVIFAFACASTACLCPLVFGFPTEMWVAHALFWPALAASHCGRRGVAGFLLVLAMMLALVLTHEAGLVLAAVIVCTLLLRGPKDAAFLRAAASLLVALPIWMIVKLTLPPDAYDGPVMWQAALHFFDPGILTSNLLVVLYGALIGYGIVFVVLRRHATKAHFLAASIVAASLAVYWLWFDRSLHAEQRYYMRTVVLLGTAALGVLAVLLALDAEGRLSLSIPPLRRLLDALHADVTVGAVAGAVLVVVLVHAVETAKFVSAWASYRAAVRALATGPASDPALGDPDFVSSARIGAALNRLSWFSTTPYLSVLAAPGFAPARLVADPTSNYFWLTCATATANEMADRAIPPESRRLVRVYACLHR
jgi:hypothetical protein